MKKLTICAVTLLFSAIAAFAAWLLITPSVSPRAVDAAINSLQLEMGSLPKEGTLLVVDFTQPSFRKRLVSLDLKSGKRHYQQVAHGRNSGGLFATAFSDAVGSRMSSLGLYRVDKKYWGKHGPSFRLIGLSKALNHHAERRGIVIHAADYVSVDVMLMNARKGFRIGRSEGCFALNNEGFAELSYMLRPQAFLFAYGGN